METKRRPSGALSARSMLTSLVLHVLVLAVLMLLPAQVLRPAPPKKEIDIVFYRPPAIKVTPRAAPLPVAGGSPAAGAPPGAPAPALKPKPNAPAGPDGPGKPELPRGPVESVRVEAVAPPQPKVGNVGILAFKEKFASLAQDKIVPLRSEEHTSELQSRSDIVCRLLLEKKKNNSI